ncbi:MAG: hypothetical protein J0L82_15960 [Deltaproteobacteria bacterium]|nr:hypothetical protein [Deltaproteobacteria bacterium]
MKFFNYHLERPGRALDRQIKKACDKDMKIAVWNAFVDSELPGITDDDFSIRPRVLPVSYLQSIKRTAYLVTKFTLKLLSLPENEIRAIIPRGPIRDHLLDNLEVLKYRNGRITGSYRFDMAIVDPPDPRNPPQLLELNEIGFDGLARSTFFQKTLIDLLPQFRGRFKSLDTAAAEIRNMQRLGKSVARIQYDSYNWDEEYLVKTGEKMGSKIRLISPTDFGLDLEPDQDDTRLLQQKSVKLIGGRTAIGGNWFPDSINFSFAYTLSDYQDGHSLYRNIVRSKTPQYGPFLTGLVAAKTILTLLDDPLLRKKLLGQSNLLGTSILPAELLSETLKTPSELKKDAVLKYTDGCGGTQVYMNQDLVRQLARIPKNRRHEWVVQKKTKLNLIELDGILSRPKQAIADLGVFVQFDWNKGRFQHFEVGGLMSRATNKSLKVNVSSGGSQVAVLLDRKT